MRRIVAKTLASAVVAVSLVNCGGGHSSSGSNSTNENATKSIGSAGGSIALSGVGALTFNKDSLSSNTTVTLRKTLSSDFAAHFDRDKSVVQPTAISSYHFQMDLTGQFPKADTVSLKCVLPADIKAQLSDDNSPEVVVFTPNSESGTSFYLIGSKYSTDGKSLEMNLPNWAFAELADNKYEATAMVIVTPGPKSSYSATRSRDEAGCEATSLSAPIDNPQVTNPLGEFGPRNLCPDPATGLLVEDSSHTCVHDGVDLVALIGSPVYAADSGTVLEAAPQDEGGNVLRINHVNGVTTYAHLSEFKVTPGAKVSKGQLVALSGNTGKWTTGPHLHFSYYRKGQSLNGKTPINPLPCIGTSGNGSVNVADDGPDYDDIFQVSIDGKVIGSSPQGSSDSFSIGSLIPGTHQLVITCTLDGTHGGGGYRVSLGNGVQFSDGSTVDEGVIDQGQSATYTITVSSSRVVLSKPSISYTPEGLAPRSSVRP